MRHKRLSPSHLETVSFLPAKYGLQVTIRLSSSSAIKHTFSISFQGVVIQISTTHMLANVAPEDLSSQGNEPSESSEQSKLPDEPNRWTWMSCPGHSLLNSLSSF